VNCKTQLFYNEYGECSFLIVEIQNAAVSQEDSKRYLISWFAYEKETEERKKREAEMELEREKERQLEHEILRELERELSGDEGIIVMQRNEEIITSWTDTTTTPDPPYQWSS